MEQLHNFTLVSSEVTLSKFELVITSMQNKAARTEHPFQRTELLKITRQGISWRYTEYKLNT